ncbi:MAG: xanthine phosphoribosyltransferase [Ruminococcaceae bacterium]|nr:xanthine phosphoribosyltransferase [Oscillospiraceae bacterium]
MELLKQKILNEGEVYEGNILKVDCFLNHQIDCAFMREIGKEFHRLYKDEGINKVLTIEASGIAIGTVVAQELECPLVFAKKTKTKNIAGDVYTTPVESFTHGTTYNIMVSKRFLGKGDRVLIVDDFLAVGNALRGLIKLVEESGAELVGCGTVIEKGYQHGGDALREQGIRVESLAIVESMNHETGEVIFRNDK